MPRRYAAEALGAMADLRYLEALRAMSNDSDEQVRQLAEGSVRALLRLADKGH